MKKIKKNKNKRWSIQKIAQELPLNAANGIRFSQEMMIHYCKMENTRLRHDDFMGRFREVTKNNRLDKL